MIRSVVCTLGALVLVLASASAARAQNAVDMALGFYAKGGVYCFRIVPQGTALSEETEWTVMMLTAASNHHNTFRIRSVDPGDTGGGSASSRIGMTASSP